MDETFSYLLQSARLIKSNKHSKEDVDFLFDLILSVDNETIIRYNTTYTVATIGCDYNLLVKLSLFLIRYYEENEEYEKCDKLKNRIDETEKIIKQNPK